MKPRTSTPPALGSATCMLGAALVILGPAISCLAAARPALAGDATVAFEPAETYPLGRVSEPVALGDLNGDGKIDAVVANTGNDGGPGIDTVSVLLGDGAGKLLHAGDFTAGDRPEGIALGDLNGDGSLDIVAADLEGSTVAALLGDGSGKFKDPVYTAVPGGPRSLVVADWSSDGIPDLATANYDGDTVSVLLGSGSGAFLILETLPAGDGPEVIALARLDGEPHPDLVTADALGGTVTPFLNDGSGRFAPAPPQPAGTRPRFVLASDLDGDGLDDLLVADYVDDRVLVEKSLGAGAMAEAGSLSFKSPDFHFEGPSYLALADATGDGRIDVLATWALSDVFTIFPGGAGPFELGPPSAHATGRVPVGIAAADLDSDGGVDVIVANALDGSCSVHRTYRNEPGVIVDDGAPGTTATGPWLRSEASFAYGGGSLFSKDGTRYRWDAALPEPGPAEAMVWWTATMNRAQAVPVEVRHAAGTSTLLVDQRVGVGVWHSLGTYDFGAPASIELSAPRGSTSVSADAVRFRPRRDLASSPPRGAVSVAASPRPERIALSAERTYLAFHGTLTASNPAEAEEWAGAVFAPVGEGEEGTSIARCVLAVDSNANGSFDEADRQVGEPASFGSDIRVIPFVGFTEPLPDGTPLGFFVVCELSPEATGGLQLELESVVTRGASTGTPSTDRGLPAQGWVFPPPQPIQRPGDGNQDGRVDISDAVHLLNFLFLGLVERLPCGGGTRDDPGNVALLDSNGDAAINLSDAIRVLGFLFGGQPPPVLGRACRPLEGCPDNSARCGG